MLSIFLKFIFLATAELHPRRTFVRLRACHSNKLRWFGLNYLKLNGNEIKRGEIQLNFGAEDAGRLAPFKDDKPKGSELIKFKALTA